MLPSSRHPVLAVTVCLSVLLGGLVGGTEPIAAQQLGAHAEGDTSIASPRSGFVQVRGTDLVVNGNPYHFLGVNLWYAMNLGSPGEGGDRARLRRELDRLESLGVTNLRIMAGSEGPASEPRRVTPALQPAPSTFNEDLLRGLDFALAEMEKRNMRAVLCLNNFFQWTGGMAQYVSWATGTDIPYPHEADHTWGDFQNYATRFFANEQAQQPFFELIYTLIHRRNAVTGEVYHEDPTIMAWQLANEPRGFDRSEEYVEWVDRTAGVIQALDPNHLVSLGGEGTLFPVTQTQFERVSRLPEIDYLTAHLWLENWGWYDPQAPDSTFSRGVGRMMGYVTHQVSLARDIGKPIVFEEFGVGRDGGQYDPDAPTMYRDRFYQILFEMLHKAAMEGEPVAGGNVWSWTGEARAPEPGEFWAPGDPFTGDPPHERQGWYSIYMSDTTTLRLLDRYASRMAAIGNDEDDKRPPSITRVPTAGPIPLEVPDVVTLLTLTQIKHMGRDAK